MCYDIGCTDCVCGFEGISMDILHTGDWSNGMTEVSKTFSGSSILSSPVIEKPWKQRRFAVFRVFVVSQ